MRVDLGNYLLALITDLHLMFSTRLLKVVKIKLTYFKIYSKLFGSKDSINIDL